MASGLAAAHRVLCTESVARQRTLDAAEVALAEAPVKSVWRVGPHRPGGAPRLITAPCPALATLRIHLTRCCARAFGPLQPYDVVLSAVLDVAQESQITGESATTLQAAWRRRNVQGKFQTAVQEMMEINGLIEVHRCSQFPTWQGVRIHANHAC